MTFRGIAVAALIELDFLASFTATLLMLGVGR